MSSRFVSAWILSLAVIASASASTHASAQSPTSRLTFFEDEVRPLLARRCLKCHGEAKQESGLRLDHIRHIEKGGERGPAIHTTSPARSRILHAISYTDVDLQMPPDKMLAASEVEVLRRWITSGAAWPDEPLPGSAPRPVFDLQGRKAAHWAWQPTRDESPPTVDDPEWRANPIDRFILRKLQEKGLTPSPLADRQTLLRRVTFDLTGLPPTPEELDAFAKDHRATAFATVVDRLIASPQFGEHWARHWLDVVRFAETLGHEFDYAIHNAWRYRDYVIRAFNQDLGYDQFVREHIAGDLIESPRKHPTKGFNESIIGTGFYWFVEQAHSPVDVRKHNSDRTHNQIDVLAKAFVGLTVGCARCHDHKFDAISTEDYYALSGYLKSSRYMQRDTNPVIHRDALVAMQRSSKRLTAAWANEIRRVAVHDRPLFLATAEGSPADTDRGDAMKRWRDALADKQIGRDVLHPMRGLFEFRKHGERDVRQAWLGTTKQVRERRAVFAESKPVTLIDFRRQGYADWFKEGTAFGEGPSEEQTMLSEQGMPTAVRQGGWADSSTQGLRAQGTLHSKRFTIDTPYLHILAHGRDCRIKVVLEGFNVIRNPIYGTLTQFVNSTQPRWYTVDLRMWPGKHAYLVLSDQVDGDLGEGKRRDGYLAVQRAVFATTRNPPSPHADMADAVFARGGKPIRTLVGVVDAYCRAMIRAADALQQGSITTEQARLLNWMWEKNLLVASTDIETMRKERVEIATSLDDVMHVPAMADGNGEDENIFIRGGHNSPGAIARRGFLTAIAGRDQRRPDASGSGRLGLADSILAPNNPFTSRVMVNRLWHHVFGRGLVSTVDNFGVQGKRPSHPLLLDWLARQFVRDDWSMKQSIRCMVLSRTYRQSSRPDADRDARDPELEWLHRMPVRRLRAESIRDAILQTSGRLDRKMFGPSVPTKLTRFMTGRGRPRSGPLDGAGRRSIYLTIGRNFLSPFLLAFDFPQPTTTMGRRNVTNVPAQALCMLNDPFVGQQVAVWAKRITTSHANPSVRIRAMYREAFARDPLPHEERKALQFLDRQSAAYRCRLDDARPWQDLCHALWNVKEFLFIR